MKKRIASTALAPIVVAQLLERGDPGSGNPTGAYVGGGWGQFDLHLHNVDDVGTDVDTIGDSKDNAWKVFAGYRFNPYWSLEAACIDFGQPATAFRRPAPMGPAACR